MHHCTILRLLPLTLLLTTLTAVAGDLQLLAGTTPEGKATELWLAMLDRRLDDNAYAQVADINKPLTAAETAWAGLIRQRALEWPDQLPALQQVFPATEPPANVRIVLGNRGASDAFTHDEQTIGFDLSALQVAYGDAADNEDRIDRLFRHEYSHLMQKAWWRDNDFDLSTPQRLAIAEIWAEGMGNYFSMSDSWRAVDGIHSDKSARTLETLEPVLVARLAALACANDEQARRLTADLSRGRFNRKWGALTAALWLERDMSVNPTSLREFATAGPDAVWNLAARHLPEALQHALADARHSAELCQSDR